ncbi:MAG: enoyl-CoA hydratase/isomerase family protein, partial [Kaistella sp.]
MYTQLEIESHLDGKLQIAYLNQPETFNSLNKTLLSELRNFIKDCSKSTAVRCVAISGRGKAFCSGQNLKEALAMGNTKEERIIQRIVIDYYNPLVKEIALCKKPVVSLVN